MEKNTQFQFNLKERKSRAIPKNTPKILLVEDNDTTARMLTLFLKDAAYHVVRASTGEEALGLFGNQLFDLIVLDLMLPGVNGMEVCHSIRERSLIPILMLTAKSSEKDVIAGLEAGADDYVTKPFDSKVLLARIRSCMRRSGIEIQVPSRNLKVGGIEIDIEKRIVLLNGQVVRLTRSEFDILHLMMRKPGKVLTRSQIIESALGFEFDGFERSIDTHIWNLRKKLLEPKGDPKFILSEPGVGYRLNDCHED